MATQGRLFYLVGSSGVGKDTLLHAMADSDPRFDRLRVARRYITRAPRQGDEQNLELTRAEFAARQQAGEFVFAWQSHGFDYAIGREILGWLDVGDDVIVNGSRDYLTRAREIYPSLRPLWMSVSDDILRQRLSARGRETAAQIEARLERNRRLADLRASQDACIENNGRIDEALAQLAAICGRQR